MQRIDTPEGKIQIRFEGNEDFKWLSAIMEASPLAEETYKAGMAKILGNLALYKERGKDNEVARKSLVPLDDSENIILAMMADAVKQDVEHTGDLRARDALRELMLVPVSIVPVQYEHYAGVTRSRDSEVGFVASIAGETVQTGQPQLAQELSQLQDASW